MNVWLLFFNMMITHSGPCEVIANDRILGEDLAKALPGFLDKIPGDAVIGLLAHARRAARLQVAGVAAHRRPLWRHRRTGRAGVFRMERCKR